ncbi:MAG: class II glutamine amidotransferase [Candidatus Omnitrophica bacterium]|nr:class II glutamine amidotransferase [Candidatus Omnitrophota bacterium]MDD5352020.1 class II glutamine amidotransferase [Candidatus Omnitrophota bacterium]MDD5551074.1 class II glutamine amidotransferase [Candidatus Omnitrophota bacterium]
MEPRNPETTGNNIYRINPLKYLVFLFIAIILSISFPAQLRADCRLWAAVSRDKIPEEVTLDQLLRAPRSLKVLGAFNRDGWGIGYYLGKDALLIKGMLSADKDEKYNQAVIKVAHLEPKIIVAHVRIAVSGCRNNAVNPHPFTRDKGGKHWLFGHNGIVGKAKLIDLIGDKYLKANPPNTCTYDPPDSWVGSELYFIFLLKCIEESNWDVEKGIKKAISILESVVRKGNLGFNFFLTDGETIWAFRKGRSLYYYYQSSPQYSVVASECPYADKGKWTEVPEGSLVIMKPGAPVVLKSISAPVAQ